MRANEEDISAEALFRAVVDHHGASRPPASSGFGSGALKTGGRIFATLSRDRLLLKLPRARVEALIDADLAIRFSTGPGREKKEWALIAPSSAQEWIALSEEARAFVAGPSKTSP